ncbi:MAG: hypothetical protein WAT12_08800 [Candidatus Nitrotoga sp.]
MTPIIDNKNQYIPGDSTPNLRLYDIHTDADEMLNVQMLFGLAKEQFAVSVSQPQKAESS